MARVKQSFVQGYLNNKLLESVKPLNEIKDALDPSETELIERVDGIINDILSIDMGGNHEA